MSQSRQPLDIYDAPCYKYVTTQRVIKLGQEEVPDERQDQYRFSTHGGDDHDLIR